MPLTPAEQDALRQIEGHLAAADPTLVAYLAGRWRCRRPGIRLLTMYLVAPLLIGVGLGAHLLVSTVAGLLLAPATPALTRWALHRPGRASRQRRARRPAPTTAESVPTTPTTWPLTTAPGCWFGMWWW